MKLHLRPVTVPMRAPFAASHGTLEVRELLLCALHDDGGLTGYGEAAPLYSYDGVRSADARDALEDCRGELASASLGDVLDPIARTDLLARCERRAVLPQALAAIDLALWDLAGRARREPVWRLLGGSQPPRCEVNWTIASADRSGAARETQLARELGFGTVKAKVGLGDDAGRIAAIRAAAGPDLALRIDANGAWEPEEAERWLEVLAPAEIELCEEPVAGAEAIERLAAGAPMPLAVDESAVSPVALNRRCAQAICLKLTRSGGITGLLGHANQARSLGYEVFLASTFDGPLGIAAAVHAAVVIAPDRACGLATLASFSGRPDPVPVAGGMITVPPGDGLGDALAGWY